MGLRQIGNVDAVWFKSAALRSDYSRYRIVKELCERVGWRNSGGQLCLTNAYLALPRLADQVGVKLPELRAKRPGGGEIAEFSDAVKVQAELSELGQVSVEPVKAEERKSWASMMHSFHPQGQPQLPGKALKYWIVSERYGLVWADCHFMRQAGMSTRVMRISAGAQERGSTIWRGWSTMRVF